jgi:thiol-disulfide isomerase/thioredoxin
MKKLLAAIFLLAPLAVFAHQKPDVYIFTSPTCMHCIKFKKELLPKLKKQYAQEVNFLELDTSKDNNSLKLTDLAKQYGQDAAVPALVAGKYFLLGYPAQIGFYADEAIKETIARNHVTKTAAETTSQEVFKSFTLAAILFNGLVDGVNPCAFAVIVFFVSFLSVYGYNRKEVFYVGGTYCLAVFVTYILLGLGVFNALYAFEGFHYAVKTFYILTALVCFVFFALSLYDLYMYAKTGDGKSMLLRLPDSFKIKINKIIGFFLRDKEKSTPRLVAASLAVGFTVSVIEAVCTGQVYIPTIVLIMKEPSFRLQAAIYLLLYNLMFILPLLVIFAMSLAGQKSERLNTLFKNNLGIIKALLALVFLGLGITILIS